MSKKKVMVPQAIWSKNNIGVLQRLGIVEYNGNGWNDSCKFPEYVSIGLYNKLKVGYFQEGCQDILELRARAEKLEKQRMTPVDLNSPEYKKSTFDFLSGVIHNMKIQLVQERNRQMKDFFNS